jgi:hypothetical protein
LLKEKGIFEEEKEIIDSLFYSVKKSLYPIFFRKFLDEKFIENSLYLKIDEEVDILNKYKFVRGGNDYFPFIYCLVETLKRIKENAIENDEFEIVSNIEKIISEINKNLKYE